MKPILETKNLCVSYGDTKVLENININLNHREILGIVGESGSGKSTLLKSLVNLLPSNGKIEKGSIYYKNKDLINISTEELRQIRGNEISMVFQNSGASLCPIRTIEKQFIETAKSHKNISKVEVRNLIDEIFPKIHLKDVDRILKSYPFELSGGMNQRVGIALAMISNPSIILADEPTSALDVTAQAQVVKTLMELRDTFSTSIIIITHNMGVISYMVDKVAVMYGGIIVEYGNKKDIINRPLHPYTQMLIKATPGMKKSEICGIPGKAPSFGEEKIGCAFASRCNKSINKCFREVPSTVNYENRIINCHLYNEITEEEIIV